jgi:DNA invertase Pin-like site-specific DNA recombinase/gamma-glutamylcyclotransferase (GGCT)/AIG2-like uncharacterized protein YtfP
MTAIYARQSIEKRDSISIDNQIELCAKTIEGEYKTYIDRGYSGKNTDRPAFQQLIDDVKSGAIKKICVYRLDRISRSIMDFGSVWNLLDKNGVEFMSVNERFETSTPVGRAMIYIIMVFAQLERETIAERVKDNYYQRARRGTWVGGPAPLGYSIQRKVIGDKKSSVLVPNSYINNVIQIFEKYANENFSLGKLAAHLYSLGIKGAKREKWDNVSLSRILHNPVYVKADESIYYYYKSKGLIVYNEIEDFKGQNGCLLVGKRDRGANKYTLPEDHLIAIAEVPGVISSDQFLKVQDKLSHNKQIKNTGGGKHSWLSGVIKCGYCGYSMKVLITQDKYKYKYFVCSGKANMKLCTAKHADPHITSVEAAAEKLIEERIAQTREERQAPEPANVVDKSAIKAKLHEIDKKIASLLDSLENANETSSKYVHKRLYNLDTEKRGYLEQINQRPPEQVQLDFTDKFSTLSFNEKKAFVKKNIKSVQLSNEKITLEWKH